jgi:Protein of unknown function (DUF1592)/Protein of unknown function (DUF1588)/Protein of unknown function (DUF1587)/Protein of unknown function (DUF1585)/Protein of unknown function (DUF1595)/Planctomycete cytochrome C
VESDARDMTEALPKVLAGAAMLLVGACTQSPEQALASRWEMLGRYCTDCHNAAEFAGELSLQRVAPTAVAAHPETWERVVRRLRGGVMPPPGEPRPAAAEIDGFVAALEAELDAAAESGGPSPGRVALHRLNRVEYQTAIRDLLGVDVDASHLLPTDVTSDGFDNVAEVLRVSPTYLDQYIAAARAISIEAVGDPASQPVRTQYHSDNWNHTSHVKGLPLGTRDGLVVEHYFPADGEYVFNLDVSSEPGAELRAYPQGWLEYPHQAIMTIDGRQVFQRELGGDEDLRRVDRLQISAVEEIKARFHEIRLPVKAGYHKIAATFLARSYAESDFALQRFVPGEGLPDVPQMLGFTVVGPYGPSGISGSTRSRARVFICHPETEREELPCAERILSHLARIAFRRPVTDEDLATVLGFYRSGRESGGFESGIQKGLFAILASTKFLYRGEFDGPPALAPGTAYPVSDLELASRLSFFLWSEGPDEELLALAEQQRLGDPAVYQAQIERMMSDPRSKALVTNFAFQWLGVRSLDTAIPDAVLYPSFDADLRNAFRQEMELFLDSVLRSEDRSVVDLLTASYTFVNERLARHYGIPGVRGDRFRRVELEDPQRWGLLGKGSILTTTSYPDRTSPVLRGAWVMEQLLGTPPTPPPPGVETNLVRVVEQPRSVRERLALHRTSPSCNHCHGVIDPLGQALENYSAVGEWRLRERDTGVPVDPNGELASGGHVGSPSDLREALSRQPAKFVQTVTEKLMTYALGRTVEYYDMPTVRAIVRESAQDHYSFVSIVKGVAESAAFRMRTVPRVDDTERVAATVRH